MRKKKVAFNIFHQKKNNEKSNYTIINVLLSIKGTKKEEK